MEEKKKLHPKIKMDCQVIKCKEKAKHLNFAIIIEHSIIIQINLCDEHLKHLCYIMKAKFITGHIEKLK